MGADGEGGDWILMMIKNSPLVIWYSNANTLFAEQTVPNEEGTKM